MTSASAQPLYRIESVIDPAQVDAIGDDDEAVLVFGPGAVACDVTAALDLLAANAPHTRCTSIVLGARDGLADFQPLIDADRLFYLSCGDLPERQLDALIDAARGTGRYETPADLFWAAEDLRRMARAESVAEVAEAAEHAIGSVIDASRSRCVLFEREQPAATGLAGFIVRTGTSVRLPRLAGDPRLDPDVDNPDGKPSDRFLGVPVRAPHGAIVAVLIALRTEHDCPFEPEDIAILETLAIYASRYLGPLTPASRARRAADARANRAAERRGPRSAAGRS